MRGRRRRRAASLWASVLVIAFTAGALVGCAKSGDNTAAATTAAIADTTPPTPTTTPTTTEATVPGPVDPAVAADRAAAIPLNDSDAPDGWAVADDDQLSGLLEGCGSDLFDRGGGAAASGQQFSRDDAGGSFASIGYVLSSIADAPQLFDDLNGDELQGCILQALPALAHTPDTRVSAMSVSRLNLPALGERTAGLRYVVALVSDSDPEAPGLVYDLFWVLNGREIAGMVIGGSGSSPPDAVKERLLRALGAKIGAAPGIPAPETAESDEQTQPSEPAPPTVATAELEELVGAWYEESDPLVCEQMTDAMLNFGWAATGDEGRQECKRNLEAAAPASDVTVKPAKVGERRITIDVSYTVSDGRNVDRITFVRKGDEWLINQVRLTGFE